MALCGKGCRGCVHYRRIGADMACHYCVDTGKLRGCEIKNCKRYVNDPKLLAEIKRKEEG